MKKYQVIFSFLILSLNYNLLCQTGSLDASFNPGVGANQRIYDTKFNTDGRILLGGLFSEYQYYLNDVPLVSIESNGDIYNSFYASGIAGTFHEVYAINELSGGDIIVSGAMYNYNSSGIAYNLISRLSPTGAYNSTFAPPLLLNGITYGLAIQSDDKIVYGAYYTDAMNTTIPLYKLERLNPTNGTVDATFNTGTGPNHIVKAIAIQSDGKMIIAGDFTSYNGTAKNHIARINANGTIDNTFNVGTGFNHTTNSVQIRSVKIQSDGKVIVAGDFTSYNGTARSGIVRINTNGSVDNTFNPGTGALDVSETGVYDLAIQSDGKILIAGSFHTYNGTSIKGIARLNSTGTLDATFNPGTGPNNTIRSILIQSDGKIIIAGDFTSYNGTTRNRVARLLNCSPPTITSTTPNSRCGTGTVSIGATASAGTINWYTNSTGGSSLGTGTTFTTPSISSNTTYYVDATNAGCTSTRTAVTASVNAIPTITGSTPNSRCGTGTLSIGATASTGTINWFTNSSGGSSIATGTSYTTPSISSNTTYYVDATNAGCTSTRTAVTASVNTIPSITSINPNSRCGSGTVNLSATASAGTINWYANSTGVSSLGTGTTFTTPLISSNTVYYVDATSAGCTSTRTAITASIGSTPSVTSVSSTTVCSNNSATISASASNGTISWFESSTGGTEIGTGNIFTSPILTTTTIYYAEANNNGCVSTRTAVNITVNNSPAITSTTPGNRCGTGTVSIGATASAGTINWYANPSGGSILGTGTTFTSPSISNNTIYYAEASDNTCNSPRTAVTASINTIPNANVVQNGNVLSATESGMTYQWIDCNNSNTPISGQTSQSYTATTNGNYAVKVNNGSCEATSSCINVIITNIENIKNKTLSIFAYPNPSSDEVTIKSHETLTSIKVYDMMGALIENQTIINDNSTILNCSEWKKGAYIVKCETITEASIIKLIIN